MSERDKLVLRGLRTKRGSADRRAKLAVRASARRKAAERSARAFMEHGGVHFAARFYATALHCTRRAESLAGN